MNICYPISYPGLGGSEKYAVYLATKAKESGHRVLFVLGQAGPLEAELKAAQLEYVILPMQSSFNPLLVLRSVLELKKLYLKRTIEIVHTQMLREHALSLFAKSLGAKVKVIRTFHRLNQFNAKTKLFSSFYKKFTDSFIAVSDTMRETMVQHGITKKVVTIYNGAPEVKVENHLANLGFLGRVNPEKGLFNFVKFNREILKNQKLIVAGDGLDLPRIKDYVRDQDLAVVFLGNTRDLGDYFSQISILIFPTDGESTLPLAIMESFSAGVPVVAFDVLGIKSSYTNADCLILVKSGEYEKMGREALKLLGEKNRLQTASQKAHESYLKNFTIDKMWRKTEQIYNKVLRDEA